MGKIGQFSSECFTSFGTLFDLYYFSFFSLFGELGFINEKLRSVNWLLMQAQSSNCK